MSTLQVKAGSHTAATTCACRNRASRSALVCRAHHSSTRTQEAGVAQPAPATSRRDLLLAGLALVAPALAPAAANAGVVEFWKGRQRANSAKFIAPIKVAQQRLETAASMLANGGSPAEVLQMVRASSLNCYAFEALPTDTLETRASLFTASAKLSDPCTFRIIIKNVTDFTDAEDKAAGSALLDSLIRSYQLLDSELEAAAEAGAGAGSGRAGQQLATTLALTQDVESFVKRLLSA
ncbi:hypothetical protein HYH02_014132 [Chlamydomonas schloesseri]|uniref:Uncharacterized protein n=1 Tax=Chlamydomonas schloesseri TaxID=2026947 RepID=A0A835SZC8_9CHLO|nr:hypothetical protein HYH02_014132 [Chlamydomonas schloesseri]|eukprot:KAG2429200.1 hypothetical protein HYH02_014132 [Chlamydomonas schloesseri]